MAGLSKVFIRGPETAKAAKSRFRPGERPTDGRLRRPGAEDTEPGQHLRGLEGDPLPDHHERAGPGQHRRQPGHQQHRQRVADTAGVSRVGQP